MKKQKRDNNGNMIKVKSYISLIGWAWVHDRGTLLFHVSAIIYSLFALALVLACVEVS